MTRIMKKLFYHRGTEAQRAEFANDDAAKAVVMEVGFENEMAVGADGLAQIAPYGDFVGTAVIPNGTGGFKKIKAVQRMDAAAVAQMVNEYQESRKGLTKFFKSRPLFLGHPDARGVDPKKYPDKTPKGVFANVMAKADGFFGEVILTEEGERIMAGSSPWYLSGRWDADPTDETTVIGGETLPVYRPCKFWSAGLTKTPRLPVQMMNEDLGESSDDPANNKNESETNMKKKLITFLKKMKVELANDATDEQLEAGIGQAETSLTSTETQFANDKSTLETKVTAKDTQIGTLTTERDNYKTSFANERKARIGDVIGQAMTSGRITAAEKPDWERRLGVETQFSNELEALTKLTAKVKTGSVTITRGERKVELANEGERAEMVNELVAEVVKEKGWKLPKDYTAAYNEVAKRHPGLFEAMQQPKLHKRK